MFSLRFGSFPRLEKRKFPVISLINREFGIPARGKRGFRENRGIQGRKRVSPGVAKNGMRQNRAEARPLRALFSDVWQMVD